MEYEGREEVRRGGCFNKKSYSVVEKCLFLKYQCKQSTIDYKYIDNKRDLLKNTTTKNN